MLEVLERVAKNFALAVFDIIEWALRKVTVPEG